MSSKNNRIFLTESPDQTDFEGIELDYTMANVYFVFSIYKNKISKKTEYIITLHSGDGEYQAITSDSLLSKDALNKIKNRERGGFAKTHYDILTPIAEEGLMGDYYEITSSGEIDRDEVPVSGRGWLVENNIIAVSVWENLMQLKPYLKILDKVFKAANIDPNKVYIELINRPEDFIEYNELRGKSSITSTISPEIQKRLRQQQHFIPDIPKAFKGSEVQQQKAKEKGFPTFAQFYNQQISGD